MPAIDAAASPCGITFAHVEPGAIASADRSRQDSRLSVSIACRARMRPSISITDSPGKPRRFHAVGSHRMTPCGAVDTVDWPQGEALRTRETGVLRLRPLRRDPRKARSTKTRIASRVIPSLPSTAIAEPGRARALARRDPAHASRRALACRQRPRARTRHLVRLRPGLHGASRVACRSRAMRHPVGILCAVRGDSGAMIAAIDGGAGHASVRGCMGIIEPGRATDDAPGSATASASPAAHPILFSLPRSAIRSIRRAAPRIPVPARTAFHTHHQKEIP